MFHDLINFPQFKKALVFIAFTLLLNLMQNTVFANITPFGVYAMFIPTYLVAVGMFQGGVWGGFIGLLAGFLCDKSFSENTVLFTIVFPAIGFFSGMLAQFFINQKYFSYIFTSLGALILVTATQIARPWIFSGAQIADLALTGLFQILWSMPFAAILYFPVRKLARKKFK